MNQSSYSSKIIQRIDSYVDTLSIYALLVYSLLPVGVFTLSCIAHSKWPFFLSLATPDLTSYAPLLLICLGWGGVTLGFERLVSSISARLIGLVLCISVLFSLVWIEYYQAFLNYPRASVIIAMFCNNPGMIFSYAKFYSGSILWGLLGLLLLTWLIARYTHKYIGKERKNLLPGILGIVLLALGIITGTQANLANSFRIATQHSLPQLHLTGSIMRYWSGQDIDLALQYRPQADCSQNSAISTQPNIILVVMESLRADHFPAYGYTRMTTPYLDKTRDRWLVFQNYFSSAPITEKAFFSILTGQYSVRSEDPGFLVSVRRLWQTLANQGYNSVAISTSTLRWGKVERLFPRELVNRLDLEQLPLGYEKPLELDLADGSADDWYALSWLKKLTDKSNQKNNKPLFAIVCPQTMHYPYRAHQRLAQFTADDERISHAGRTTLSKTAGVQGTINQYDDSLLTFDSWLHDLEQLLSEQGILEDTLIIVTGDHAESLGENGEYYHGHNLSDTQIKVPLLMRVGSKHVELKERLSPSIKRIASHVDLAATITRLAGSIEAFNQDGSSLVDNCQKPYEIIPYNFLSSKLAVIDENYKYIYDLDLYQTTQYSRLNDKEELHNLYSGQRQSLSEFLDKLEKEGVVARALNIK